MSGTSEHHELRMALGAYVLGHLGEDERLQVEAHLRECADCRAELEELRPVAQEMALLGGPLPETGNGPPADLGARIEAGIAAAARRTNRRRFLLTAGVASVAAASLGIVLVAGLNLTRPDPAPVLPLEAVQVDSRAEGVRANADLVAHTWGVEVKLRASGFDEGARYRVSVVTADGTSYSAGEFVGTGDQPMTCNLNSAVLRDEAVAFEVQDNQGKVVVQSSFPA